MSWKGERVFVKRSQESATGQPPPRRQSSSFSHRTVDRRLGAVLKARLGPAKTMDLFSLRELVIVLAASVLIIYLSQKLKLPAVVGFLLTGVLIGPGGLSLVKNTRTVDILAEVGVVMLRTTA